MLVGGCRHVRECFISRDVHIEFTGRQRCPLCQLVREFRRMLCGSEMTEPDDFVPLEAISDFTGTHLMCGLDQEVEVVMENFDAELVFFEYFGSLAVDVDVGVNKKNKRTVNLFTTALMKRYNFEQRSHQKSGSASANGFQQRQSSNLAR